MEFEGAGHFAWIDLNPNYHDIINRYSVAFFDRYLKDETAPNPLDALTQKPYPKGVSDVRLSK